MGKIETTDAICVALHVLELMGPQGAMKLQKLVYYAQAWSLALHKFPLFSDPIEAWRYGPVTPSLYAMHKGRFIVAHSDLAVCHPQQKSITDERVSVLMSHICTTYGTQTGAELSRRTHSEAPWVEARHEFHEAESGDFVISHASMQKFYENQKAPWEISCV